MKKLIEDNYNSIVKRGHITPETEHIDFLNKLHEELGEAQHAYLNIGFLKEETVDVILVFLNWLRHHNVDIEEELNKKIKINSQRND